MKSSKLILMGLLSAMIVLPAMRASAADFEAGVGANYWYSLKDAVDKSFDEDGLGWMISTRWMWTRYLGLGFELERSPDNFVLLEKEMYAPSVHLVVGNGIYAGLGVGWYYYDGDFYQDEWYNVRAGLKLRFLDPFIIDINVNYRADAFDKVEEAKDADSESLTLGGAIRFAF